MDTYHITSREFDILACLSCGNPSKKIAVILGITPKTVDIHVANITKKNGVNSRVSLVGLVERNNYQVDMRSHYDQLLRAYEFKEAVRKNVRYVRSQNLACKVVCIDKDLKQRLIADFKMVGVASKSKAQKISVILKPDIPQRSKQDFYFEYLGNYEHLFFEILYRLHQNEGLSALCSHFSLDERVSFEPIFLEKAPISRLIDDIGIKQAEVLHNRRFVKNIWVWCGIVFFLSGAICINRLMPVVPTVRSYLFLPNQNNLLNRATILKQIDQAFAHQKRAIKTVILTGIGGAGKTVLARQYAQRYKKPVVLELNAETQETMTNSLLDAAELFVSTASEKQNVSALKHMENQKEQQTQTLKFIQSKLKKHSDWLIIFDNIDLNFQKQKMLPYDEKLWGHGKIILTTRDNQFREVNGGIYINIPELNINEIFKLFFLILNCNFKSKSEKMAFIKFLNQLPPFPLDVSTAAYYIKVTQAQHVDYLKMLSNNDQNFEFMQQEVRKSVGDYEKTRQNMMQATIRQILLQHQDFSDLLLCVGLFNSQNIPQDFLEIYKDKAVVSLFIRTLKKHSMVEHKDRYLSVHRSFQDFILNFLAKKLGKSLEQHISVILSKSAEYLDILIAQGDTLPIRLYLPHFLAVLKHKNEFSLSDLSLINALIGKTYYHLGNFKYSHNYISESLRWLKTHAGLVSNPKLFISVLTYLGMDERELSNHQAAQKLFEWSLLANQIKTPSDITSKAWTLLHAGRLYTDLGNYGRAKEVLHESIQLYIKLFGPENLQIAWAFEHLGDNCRVSGEYEEAQLCYEKSWNMCKKLYGTHHQRTVTVAMRLAMTYKHLGNYNRARQLFEENSEISQKEFTENQDKVGWSFAQLGRVYVDLGLYEKAESALDKSVLINSQCYGDNNLKTIWQRSFLCHLYIETKRYKMAEELLNQIYNAHKQAFGLDHIKITWLYLPLANVSKFTDQFEQAEIFFLKSLAACEQHYGKKSKDYGQTLRDFGHMCVLQKNFEKAECLLKKALDVFKASSHPEAYRCHEYLGELYVAQKKWEQAQQSYQEALKIAKANFPKESAHIARIEKALTCLRGKTP